MKPSHPFICSKYFIFSDLEELLLGLGDVVPNEELIEIGRLSNANLPPISSREAVAVMLGVNPGFVWSMENRTRRHYRTFEIKKGQKTRIINAPKVALKTVQKWISHHLNSAYSHPNHVYGFVPGRSHIDAAMVHCSARWVYSIDIEDFFPSTPQYLVREALTHIGYSTSSAEMISSLCCLNGALSQGAPSSPVLSNLVLRELDSNLLTLANALNLRMTRYADDVVFSGEGSFPAELPGNLSGIFDGQPWRISQPKTVLNEVPLRLKVHGLLVHGEHVRLTKGYRNRVRAFRHLLSKGNIRVDDLARVRGHVHFADQVIKRSRNRE